MKNESKKVTIVFEKKPEKKKDFREKYEEIY